MNIRQIEVSILHLFSVFQKLILSGILLDSNIAGRYRLSLVTVENCV